MSTQNLPVQSHDPKFLFPHQYKTVPSVYIKNTSKWSSKAQILSKHELCTPKPSQLHETVQQKCYCKISYGTTFDHYESQAISQWCDTSYLSPPSLIQRNGHFWLVQLEKLTYVTLVRPKWIWSMFSSTMETMVSDQSCSVISCLLTWNTLSIVRTTLNREKLLLWKRLLVS